MLPRSLLPLFVCLVWFGSLTTAQAQLVAERITAGNAALLLFGGTDADGGIGDWYLSNGIVELVVDDAAPQDDLPAGVVPPPKQSENALTGGTIIDLARVGEDNDQLNQIFTVGGLSFDNILSYDAVAASVEGDTARLVVTGVLPGLSVPASDLPVVTEYALSSGDDFVTITSTVTNVGSATASPLGGFFDVFPWTTRAVVPFSPLPGRGFTHAPLDPSNPLAAIEQPSFAVGPGNAGPADGVMDTQTGAVAGEVSYGLVGMTRVKDPDGPGPRPPQVADVNSFFGISGVEATAFGAAPAGLTLPANGFIRYERRLYVGSRNDVASTANRILPVLAARRGFALGTLSGDVDALDAADVAASVIATRTDEAVVPGLPPGTPVTHFRTDPDGTFSGVVVPAGTYELEVRSPERDTIAVPGVVVEAGLDTEVDVPPLSAVATLAFRVSAARGVPPRRATKGRLPAKITILGRDGTPDPRFAYDFEAVSVLPGEPEEDLRPETFGGALAQANVVYLPDGAGRALLRPGDYEVFASRGPEYGLDRALVSVAAGEFEMLSFELQRIAPAVGALSADFHIHSARSLDSSAAPTGRVAAAAGEGLEVMVSADHDFVLDYGPVIASLGLQRYVASITGVETTSNVPNPPAFPSSAGHVNGWPLIVQPDARKDGAIEDEFVAPNWLFSRLRAAGADVVQYNHLRAGVRGLGSIGFFNNIGCGRCANRIDRTCSVDADCPAVPDPRECTCVGYQPDRPLTMAPNDELLDDDVTGTSGVSNPDGTRNIDFDVMEVANGLNIDGFLLLREDWFSLLNQAFGDTPSGPVPFLPATGVSDSHRNTLESTGYFRTYVLGVGDGPRALDVPLFDARIRAGRMLVTNGPYLEVWALGSGAPGTFGDTVVATGGSVDLFIRVTASNWIPVDEVRVIANGEVVPELVFDASTVPPVLPPPAEPWTRDVSRVQRFFHLASLDLDRDTWLVVEAGAKLDPPPAPDPFASQIVPGLVPFAFTNPIFVDLAGDGFDPPGVDAARSASRVPHAHGASPHAHSHVRLHDFAIPVEAVEKLSAE